MYLTRAVISNIRSIADADWSVSLEDAPGWHVVIGDNGAGKSSFLRAIALGLVGPTEARGLQQSWGSWLRRGSAKGSVSLELARDEGHDGLARGGRRPPDRTKVKLEIATTGDVVELKPKADTDATRSVWGPASGWFSASYGPFRRFTGGIESLERANWANPKLAAHYSVFDEGFALTEGLSWLRDLKFKSYEKGGSPILDELTSFVNQEGFLPFGVKLEDVTSAGVTFKDGNGCDVLVGELSDGYRSVLSMTFELVRQMSTAYKEARLFSDDRREILMPGVVLIDEVDAHLHPDWQRQIGPWFRKLFPNVQFIVTTHSPLVCQASVKGTVWDLPRPGAEGNIRRLGGAELDRLVFGDILEAYGTRLFGEVERSSEAQLMLGKLADLNMLELSQGLSPEQESEQDALRRVFPTQANCPDSKG